MEKISQGLKLFVFDDSSMELISVHNYISDYISFKYFIDSNFKGQKLGYCKLEDNMEKFNEISDESVFEDAKNNITGQGLSLKLKKVIERNSPWRCIRCQFIEKNPNVDICSVCKLKRNH